MERRELVKPVIEERLESLNLAAGAVAPEREVRCDLQGGSVVKVIWRVALDAAEPSFASRRRRMMFVVTIMAACSKEAAG